MNKSLSGRAIVRAIGRIWQLYLLLLPSLVYIVIFCYAPMYGVVWAFKDYNPTRGILESPWVGMKYFQQFFSTSIFMKTFTNTLLLSFYSLVFSFPIPVIFALLLDQVKHSKIQRFIQTVTYAPNFISTVVLVSMIVLFLAPSSGILTNFFSLFGSGDSMYLSRPQYFRPIYIISGIWQSTGFNAIIYFAALAGVNPELHEAAMIDGAGVMRRIWSINIPAIIPTIIIMFILAMGNILSVGYEKVYLLQNGMNLSVSEVMSTYVYKVGVRNAQYSFATAVGIFNSVINLILLILTNYAAKRVSDTSLF